MADPLTIIGTAGAIANIIDILTKTITTVCDMRQAWKVADLTVLSFENQLNLLKLALCRIQKWADCSTKQQDYQLVMQVDGCITCCRLLVGKIDEEVCQFQKTAAGDLLVASKLGLLFKTKDMEQVQRMIDQQTHALTLLLTACNANAIEEQNRILQQPKVVRVFRKMDRDTASLIVHRDADSIVTASSVSSSKWSVQFTFDKELFITRVYERWIRRLATPPRTHQGQSNTNKESFPENLENDEPQGTFPIEIEQNTLSRSNSATSAQSSRSSPSLGERFASLGRNASIEFQSLKRTRVPSELEQKAQKSREIDRLLKDDARTQRAEVNVVVLGSETRKQVVEDMRRCHGDQKCYTEQQLRLFRPVILEIIAECATALATALQHHQDLDDSDPIWKYLEEMLTFESGSRPNDIELNPDFVTAMGLILEHQATKNLMETKELHLPDNAEYFLGEINRVSSQEYIPSETDAIKCTRLLPCCVETMFSLDRLHLRLIDPGSRTISAKTLVSQLDRILSVIFVFDLGSYDRIRAGSRADILENVAYFEQVVNSPSATWSSMIIIFNNVDVFRQKISTVPLSQHFPDYAGGNNFVKAFTYIFGRLNHLNRTFTSLYPVISSGASGEVAWRYVNSAVKKTILSKATKGSSLL